MLTGLGWRSLTLAASEHSWREAADVEERQPCTGMSWTHLKLSPQSILNIFKMHSHCDLPWLYPDLVMRKVREKKCGPWTRNCSLTSPVFYQGRGWENLIYTAACSYCWAMKEPHQAKPLIFTIRFVSIHWWPKAGGAEGDSLGRKCFDV